MPSNEINFTLLIFPIYIYRDGYRTTCVKLDNCLRIAEKCVSTAELFVCNISQAVIKLRANIIKCG